MKSYPVRDFTQVKEGKKVEGALVQKCPKCGRNGKYEPRRWKDKPERNYDQWTHKAQLDVLCGLGIDHVLEHCTQKAVGA